MQKKSIWQNPTLVHDKNSQKNKNTEELPQHDKERNLQKSTFDIKFNRGKTKCFSLEIREKERMSALTTLIQHHEGNLSYCIKVMGNERHTDWRERTKTVYICKRQDCIYRKSPSSHQKNS